MDHPDRSLYRYRFDEVEFDEARSVLSVAGQPVVLEQRPRQVLEALLHRIDEVVPRADLFDTVWEGRPTVDNVLANAVAKLRKGLGPAGTRIVTVPRVGYRLRGPVERIVVGRGQTTPFGLAVGQPVPGREHFILRECLDPLTGGWVWRGCHDKTGETRVYKFATDGERLAALQRETTICRLLRERLGQRDDLVRLIDWNFDSSPYWLQCEDGGTDLVRWMGEQSAFAEASRERRIAWFLQIAGAVAAAHKAGVLHKDLKPANVLVAPRAEDWQLRVADFGSGRVLEPDRLNELGITRLGLTVTSAMPSDSGVTLLYLAPELLAGAAPSARSDVYALGLILFQMLVGDSQRMLVPGWRGDIDDELLQEDIAAATNGDPAGRLADVDALIQRLRTREARAIERTRLREADARALAAERLLERSRARRPWLIAAIVVLAAGLGVSLWQTSRVRAARSDAQQQAAIAEATNRFLNDDLLGAGMAGNSPAWYQRNPSLREILDAAAQKLDTRFKNQPLLRATLHQTLGRAYRSTGTYDKAAVQLQSAADIWIKLEGPADVHSILTQYELAPALATTSRFDQAEAVLQRADKAAGERLDTVSELALHSHLAHADVAYQRLQVKQALQEYQTAEHLQRLLHPTNAAMSAHILLSIAGCQLRSGQAKPAAATARRILAGAPYTQDRVGLAAISSAHARLSDALRAQNRYEDAIAEMQTALSGYEKSEGADSQSAISALSTLSYMYAWTGDTTKALQMQHKVHDRAVKRWGANSQSALVELLNLGASEAGAGDVKAALKDYRAAAKGLAKVAGEKSPTTQAARVMTAMALGNLDRNREALAIVRKVDPAAYQATTSDPGRALVLQGLEATYELRLHQAGAEKRLRAVIAAMQAAGMDQQEIDTFRGWLASATAVSASAVQ